MRQLVTVGVLVICVCGAFALGYTVKRAEPSSSPPVIVSPLATVPTEEPYLMPDLSQKPEVEPVNRNDINFKYIALTLGVDTGSLVPKGLPILEILENRPERGPMPREVK